MDYEKAYKEALERMKSWMRGEHPECFSEAQKAAEFIFPELKESEDERIRKTIIDFLKNIEEENGSSLIFGNTATTDMIAWIEKQGEKKPVISDDALREGIAHFGITQYQIDNWLKKYVDVKKQCEQKLDKVEPKFKVGDWCIDNEDNTIFQITKLLSNLYYYRTNEGKEYSCTRDSIERDAHLWTIQDAKEGDVLATKKGNPFIYDKNRYNNGLAYYYAGLDVNKELTLKSPHHMLAHFGELCSISPATKEQRDLLFQKMKEAGYEWDAEKKELRKIEQKLWSEEDEANMDAIRKACGIVYGVLHQSILVDWLKSLKPRWKPTEKQISELGKAAILQNVRFNKSILESLYNDLKKL